MKSRRRRRFLLALTALFLGWPLAAGAGSVTGTILAPERRPASFGVDLYSKYDRPAGKPRVEGLKGVVGLLPLTGSGPGSGSGMPVPVMDQKGASFLPRIVPVTAGGSVRFLNSDPIFHNVFSLSPTRRFDLGRYPKGDSRVVRFDRPGVVQVFCDIHAEMTGFVVVLETPFFGVLQSDGAFRIDDVPAGEYDVLVWAEGMGRFDAAGRVQVHPAGVAEFRATVTGVD